mgnify:CR=1 FL=1
MNTLANMAGAARGLRAQCGQPKRSTGEAGSPTHRNEQLQLQCRLPLQDADQSDAVGVDDAMGATKAVGHGVNSTPPPVRMERECHGPLRAARGATKRV